ncbi:MAG TPA: Crp/Fnr family transcriptional regulator [Thermotogota bacterium]|nr:Crp/Fnr family transcriptional regulator [Thermotogota bacterium]HPR96009.1 Crp/Fnr family transcriptional regulator [Thermotogota bacterium]
MKKLTAQLAACQLFRGMEEEEIENILKNIQYRIPAYKKDELIVHSEDPCECIFIVMDGEIEIQKNMASGKFYNINYLKAGEVFGIGPLFSDTDTYKVDIVAKKDCVLFEIREEQVRQLFCNCPAVSLNMIRIAGNKIVQLDQRIELFSAGSIKRKIAYSLLKAANTFHSDTICLQISKKQWSEHLNVSRTSLSRELKELEEKGIISIRKNIILLLNKQYLKDIL